MSQHLGAGTELEILAMILFFWIHLKKIQNLRKQKILPNKHQYQEVGLSVMFSERDKIMEKNLLKLCSLVGLVEMMKRIKEIMTLGS